MGNLCSLCTNKTTINEINQFSINLINSKQNIINNTNLNIIDSSFISNIDESLISISNLSLNQEINYSKQSLYDFNNIIYIVNRKTNNILINLIKSKSKIKEEIKDLFFIDTYDNYKKFKNDGVYIYSIKGINFENIGIPKEIYKDKGLHYIQRKNYIEVLFIKEMKMVKIFKNNDKIVNNNNISIIHNINNFNKIESFSKKVNKNNQYIINLKEADIKENSITNYSTIIKKETNDNIGFTSIRQNKNSDKLNIDSFSDINNYNLDKNQNNILSQCKLIIQTLISIYDEENRIINSLKSKIDLKKNECYLINSDWLNLYKKIYNYSEFYNFYKNEEKSNEPTKNELNNLIKIKPQIIELISNNINKKELISELNDIKKLRYNEYHKIYTSNNKSYSISIPYNFNIINKKILDLILNEFKFKCKNFNEVKKECQCEFCENNIFKKYEYYIGKEAIFIENKDINENYNSKYYVYVYNMENDDKNDINLNINIDYILLFKNNEIFLNQINDFFNKGENIRDYFKIQNIKKYIIIQDIIDKNKNICIGMLINVKLLLNQKEDIDSNKNSSKTYKNDENILSIKNIKKYSIKKKMSRKIIFKNQPLLLYKKPSLIGLNRNGQPFFFNPILQCLSNIPELTNFFLINNSFFLDENKRAEYPFSYYYANLISELWKKPSEEDSEINNYPYYIKSFLPFRIKEYLFNINSSVLFQQKNMFRELFLYIIKLLHEELNNFGQGKTDNIKNINDFNDNIRTNMNNFSEDEEQLLKKFREDYNGRFNSIIQNNFFTEIQVSYQCLECNLYKYHYEIVNSFTFDLEKIKNNIILRYKFRDIMKKTLILSISDCFENQEKPSFLEQNILCQKCNLKTLQKQIRIIKSANILVLFFKEKEIPKIEFEISLDLQLNPFIHEIFYENEEKNIENDNILEFKKHSYNLICVLCSSTDKTKKGTYLCYCKNPINNSWYCYNDSIVTYTDNQFIKDIKIPKLLIYRRKEVIFLFFMINEEQKFSLEVNMDMVFRNVISYLYVKNPWLKNLNISSFVYNGKEIDINKTVCQNNLNNGSIIICKRGKFLKI